MRENPVFFRVMKNFVQGKQMKSIQKTWFYKKELKEVGCMKTYKIIASDLDGTLLNSSSEISKENIDAINNLNEKGVAFVPCTGRTYSEIPDKIKNRLVFKPN